jgi:Rv2525c-like, glycoside hydrolase-like domain
MSGRRRQHFVAQHLMSRKGQWAFLAAICLVMSSSISLANATTPISTHEYSKGKGFDTCEAPSTSQMNDFWNGTPYAYVGIYIGGSLRSCPNSNLTQSWVGTVDGTATNMMRYRFLPIWVGPQAPCTNFNDTFSSDPAAARERGHTVAVYAKDKMIDLGFYVPGDPTKMGPIVFYDLEGYDTSNTNCVDAVKAFIAGWTSELHSWRRLAGVYGPALATSWSSFYQIDNEPDVVWIAQDNSTDSVYGVSAPSADKWGSQRLHQYELNKPKTWNGTTLNVDLDCAKGRVTGDNGDPAGDFAVCYS